MVTIVKRKIRGKEYFYLQQSYREEGKIKNVYKEIGKEIPEDLSEIKEDFIKTIVEKRWVSSIEQFKEKYVQKLQELPEILKKNHLKDFGIRFTYHSNKIEGSTLTLLETELAINQKEVPINKPTNDVNLAQFHMQIYEDIISTDYEVELSIEMINKWHSKLFSLHPNRTNFAGMIRKDQFFISRSNYVPPPGGIICETLLKDLFKWYTENKDFTHPVLLACLMHYHFVSIHPYLDGNGRMSRLLMNFILFKNNYPMFDILAKNRQSYYNALERANIKNDDMIFVSWLFRNYIKYIEILRI